MSHLTQHVPVSIWHISCDSGAHPSIHVEAHIRRNTAADHHHLNGIQRNMLVYEKSQRGCGRIINSALFAHFVVRIQHSAMCLSDERGVGGSLDAHAV